MKLTSSDGVQRSDLTLQHNWRNLSGVWSSAHLAAEVLITLHVFCLIDFGDVGRCYAVEDLLLRRGIEAGVTRI